MDFKVETIDKETHIHLEGDLTFDYHLGFRKVLEAITPNTPRTTISLKDLQSMDSTGVGMLKLAQDQAHKVGSELHITNIPDDLQVFVKLLKE